RKTLAFGSVLPHARFEIVNAPATAGRGPHNVHTDPYAVARHFMTQYNDPEAGRAYVIRPDSYTDKATGV
ncbi:hypothetical protein PAXRUDRAFT_119254, partial [Paxillus rubicundulus Ve08.2h10]